MSEYRLTKDEADDLYASAGGNYIKMQMIRQMSWKGHNYEEINTALMNYDANTRAGSGKVCYPERFIDDEPMHAYEKEDDCYHHDDEELLKVKLTVKTVLAEVQNICGIYTKYEQDEKIAKVAERIQNHMRSSLFEYADCQLYYDEM